LFASQVLKGNDILIQVPSNLALSTSTSTDTVYDLKLLSMMTDEGKKIYREATWWAKISLQLNYLDKTSISLDSKKSNTDSDNINKQQTTDMVPWLQSLPRQFSTPIHWSVSALDELQYPFLIKAVQTQRETWQSEFTQLQTCFLPSVSWIQKITLDDFIWGCECARSRAFSGKYSGNAFNPTPYAFTLLLVTTYIGLNLGSIEQAANGAGLVLCGSILKDFILPKLNKAQRHVICPLIDMSNHVGSRPQGDVAFEYFGDCYSMAIHRDENVQMNQEVYISYGPRSNDQLLQYYGFVEKDNPYDVYVMPPLREWDIDSLERVCGQRFDVGSLQKLDTMGLLDRVVLITRGSGVDADTMSTLRTLISANDKATDDSIECKARLVLKTALESELKTKPTTWEQDRDTLLKKKDGSFATLFRLEKKKLLLETLQTL